MLDVREDIEDAVQALLDTSDTSLALACKALRKLTEAEDSARAWEETSEKWRVKAAAAREKVEALEAAYAEAARANEVLSNRIADLEICDAELLSQRAIALDTVTAMGLVGERVEAPILRIAEEAVTGNPVTLPVEAATEKVPEVTSQEQRRTPEEIILSLWADGLRLGQITAKLAGSRKAADIRAVLKEGGHDPDSRNLKPAKKVTPEEMRAAVDKLNFGRKETPQDSSGEKPSEPNAFVVDSGAVLKDEFGNRDAASKQGRLEGKIAALMAPLPQSPLPEGLDGVTFSQLCRCGDPLNAIQSGGIVFASKRWSVEDQKIVAWQADRHAQVAMQLLPFERNEYFRQIVASLTPTRTRKTA